MKYTTVTAPTPTRSITATSLLLLLASIASVSACSIACRKASSSLGSSIAASSVIVKAYVWKDISPPQDPMLPWGSKFYQGYVQTVFKGNETVTNGEIIMRGGPCGGGYPENQHVVLFGNIGQQFVRGYATPMPVFQPTACSNSGPWSWLDLDARDRLNELNSLSLPDPCQPEDCKNRGHNSFPRIPCPDGLVSHVQYTCGLDATSTQCEWQSSASPCH